MTDPYKRYRIDDLELLQSVRDQLHVAVNDNEVKRNNKGFHGLWYLGWPGSSKFWDLNPTFEERLTACVYPYHRPIMNCWIKFYSVGDHSGLHVDDVKSIGSAEEYDIGWTNSILIEQSDDIEGGDVVVAGDAGDEIANGASRLITMRHKSVGDVIAWDSELVHGVSRIEKGSRAALMITKKKKSQDG